MALTKEAVTKFVRAEEALELAWAMFTEAEHLCRVESERTGDWSWFPDFHGMVAEVRIELNRAHEITFAMADADAPAPEE